MRRSTFLIALAAGTALSGGAVLAQRPGAGAGSELASRAQGLFRQRCLQCHGGIKRQGGLSLLRREDALAAAASGRRAIVPGRPGESELLRRVNGQGRRMPPDGPPLTRAEVETLRAWIAAGAEWKRHWAFEPIRPVPPPGVREASRARGEIDRFILARLEKEGLQPSPEADRYTLVRRLSLDLTGLPPAPEEVDRFVSDSAPDAYERLVDRILASPHFGERWGRHWLDLARYADSDGYEVDKPRPHAWRWRDWVIRAINDDLPFDRFTVEQMAGDLLPGSTPMQKLATGFHRNTLTNNEGGVDREEDRVKIVIDRVSTTGTVWLGLTAGCAQCHDHPYDPVSQREFYGLYAFFNNADERELELALPGAAPAKAAVLEERPEPRTTHLFERGDFLRPRKEQPVPPAVPAFLHPFRPRDPEGRADRLDLARWLTAPENPLTARVAVNDVWLRLFGQGLVPTPEDFGATGEPPSHPELLDWLASTFKAPAAPRDGSGLSTRAPGLGWSRKALIRLIVTSATYRQASAHRPDAAARDPKNRLLSRQNRYRVEAEIVRDLHLAAGGLLSRKIGGPSVFPPIPPELVKLSFRSELPWKTSTGEDRYRRGMYTFFKRSIPDPNLVVFDCPDSTAALARRNVSNTPLQALATLNNEVYAEAARALARRLLRSRPEDDGARIALAFRLCVARPPAAAEAARLRDLLEASRAWYGRHPGEARKLVGEDRPEEAPEEAAWVSLAATVLNLDEFLTRE